MANSNKSKGDRAEREALEVICGLAPDLVVTRPQRLLGAGRREDTGDLWVLPGVTVQVKHRADPAHAIRLAAVGAAVQASRAGCAFALGLVPIPGPGRRRSGGWRAAHRGRDSRPRTLACSAASPGRCSTCEPKVRRHLRGSIGWRWCSGRPPLPCTWGRSRRGCTPTGAPSRGRRRVATLSPRATSWPLHPEHGDHRSADEGETS